MTEDRGIVARLEAILNAHQDGLPIETVDKQLLRDALAEIRRLEQERDVKLRIWSDSGSPESDFALARQLREQSSAAHTALSGAGVDATNDERPLTLAERIALSLARADALQRELNTLRQGVTGESSVVMTSVPRNAGEGPAPVSIPEAQLATVAPMSEPFSIQTHSKEHGIYLYPTFTEALRAAKADPSLWKMSFSLPTGERVRLIKKALGIAHSVTLFDWVLLEPIVLPEWSGAQCPIAPDTCWIDDVTGEHVDATTAQRTPQHPTRHDQS